MSVAEAVTPTVGQLLRRSRFWIVIAAVVVVLAVGTAVVQSTQHLGTAFDPDNPGPQGAKALRSVLQQQGVRVTQVETVAAAEAQAGTLLVDDTDATLSAALWRRLLASRSRVVVLQPDRAALDALLPEVVQQTAPAATTLQPGCALPLARRAGAMDLTDASLSLESPSDTVCYEGATSGGQLVAGDDGGVSVLLLADRTPFDNAHIARRGNAAVALNALGPADALVWFRQSPLDPAISTRRTLQQLTPPWVTPVVVLLLVAGLAAVLWRGRRLGPIVVESLPVVVRSRETVEGRARLYSRGGARLRAADSLRIGTIGRLGPLLGLPRSASVAEVAGAAARMTGGRPEALAALLVEADPRSDRDLVRLSDDLARLEAAVRSAVRAGADSAPDDPSTALMNGAR